MRKFITTVLGSVLVVTLNGCATVHTNEQGRQVSGGTSASQTGGGSGRAAAIVAGALIGGSIGHTMDESDRAKAQNALEYNRSNEPASWHNPGTGNSYTVTPTRTYTSQRTNESCREYTSDAVIDGRHQTIVGNACRQPDGTWAAVN